MKIGIITFHKENNIGALLQATATYEYLKTKYDDVEFIDYYPNSSISHGNIIVKFLRFIKRKFLWLFNHKAYLIQKKFCNFRKEYIKCSKKSYRGDKQIMANPPKYDVIISGSDQILNLTLSGCSLAYYLNFYDGKKVSYASSFGRDVLTDVEYKAIKEELSKFAHISVRESSAMDIIKKECGKDCGCVVDPTFLLPTLNWEEKCSKDLKLPQKYILVYVMQQTPAIEATVNQLNKNLNLPVILLRGGSFINKYGWIEDNKRGPADFLKYFKDAEYVVTNSFHGTAFSLIFGKKFLTISHSKRNARLVEIFKNICQEQKLIDYNSTQIDVENYIVDGKVAKGLLDDKVAYSKEFLEIALKEI